MHAFRNPAANDLTDLNFLLLFIGDL